MKANITNTGTNLCHVHPGRMSRKGQNIFSVVFLTKAKSESNHKETSDTPKLKVILQNNWPELFKKMTRSRETKKG